MIKLITLSLFTLGLFMCIIKEYMPSDRNNEIGGKEKENQSKI